ncbi:hypothetical protein GCM10023108_45940 [Saccharopolyspora hordei]
MISGGHAACRGSDLPAVRSAELSGTARTTAPQSIGPAVQGLYAELCAALERAGVTPVGPATASDEGDHDSDDVVVHAGLPVSVDPDPAFESAVVDLPAVERAATIVHRGSTDDCLPAHQALAQWREAAGHQPTGNEREVTLAGLDGTVTEIQSPIRTSWRPAWSPRCASSSRRSALSTSKGGCRQSAQERTTPMVDPESPTGDDTNPRARRGSGQYFVLPSEMADELRRLEAKAQERDSRLPAKDED